MKWIENRKNTKKTQTKIVGISYEYLRVVVSVWVYADVFVCVYVLLLRMNASFY